MVMSVAASLPRVRGLARVTYDGPVPSLTGQRSLLTPQPLQLTLAVTRPRVITKPRISWLQVIEEGDTCPCLCLLH